MMLVRLTAKGLAFLEQILPGYFRRIAAVMSKLTEAERKTLVSLMAKIHEAIPPIATEP
jgi:DNA-binding MarR family transcriptional regulator